MKNPSGSTPDITDKLRGGYYTPSALASWMCRWAVRSRQETILEPSCGDGVFLEAAALRLRGLGCGKSAAARQLCGIELVAVEANKSAARLQRLWGMHAAGSVQCTDFFAWLEKHRTACFDCVVGNPPFIRYQNFPEPSRSRAMQLLEQEGLRANKLTNIWGPFVVGGVSCLKARGRLAMVLPAELLQVSYAAQLRGYLTDRFRSIQILGCNAVFFEDAEQEVVLLLAEEKRAHATKAHACHIELTEAKDLDALLARGPEVGIRGTPKMVNHGTEKWLKYFLSAREISLLRALRETAGVASLGEHARVDVGVVTGRNEFFVVPQGTVLEYELHNHVTSLVARSAQLKGAILARDEWESIAADGQGAYLLSIEAAANGVLGAGPRRYVQLGERRCFHTGYKCSIRAPWYAVPSVWAPDCFLFRQIYDFPRVVLNRARATCTDTIHRLRCDGDAERVAANVYTHLTAASAEVEGRSYGGGVLELEPTEAERLLTPRALTNAMPVAEVDRLVRRGRVADVLAENDRWVLGAGLGLSARECGMLRDIWTKMRDRRLSRRRRPSS